MSKETIKYITDEKNLLNYAENLQQQKDLKKIMRKRLNLKYLISIILFILIILTFINNHHFMMSYMLTSLIIILNFLLIILDMNDDIDLTEYSKLKMLNVIFVTSKGKWIFRIFMTTIFIALFIFLQIELFIK